MNDLSVNVRRKAVVYVWWTWVCGAMGLDGGKGNNGRDASVLGLDL